MRERADKFTAHGVDQIQGKPGQCAVDTQKHQNPQSYGAADAIGGTCVWLLQSRSWTLFKKEEFHARNASAESRCFLTKFKSWVQSYDILRDCTCQEPPLCCRQCRLLSRPGRFVCVTYNALACKLNDKAVDILQRNHQPKIVSKTRYLVCKAQGELAWGSRKSAHRAQQWQSNVTHKNLNMEEFPQFLPSWFLTLLPPGWISVKRQ